MREDLSKCIFANRQTLNIDSFYMNSDIKGVQLPFLSWLFENQNTEICAKVLGEETIGFYSKYHTTPFDYYALAYCIANSACKWEIQVQLPTVDWLDTFSKSFQAAKSHGGKIVALDIAHCQISKTGWDFLFSDSLSPLQSLHQLIFYETSLPPLMSHNLHDCLITLPHLQCLVLSGTVLGEGEAVSLMEVLPSTNISELHLHDTGIGFPDCQALASYLSASQCKLKSVDLSYNNLNEKSVDVITNAVMQNSSLTKLSMSGSWFSSQSFNSLVSRLEGTSGRTRLTVLHMQHCALPQGGVVYLCKAIAEDEECVLQSLALGYNQLELSEVEALAAMLEINCSIVYLYLTSCSISATGLSILSSSLNQNTTLCQFSFSGNELSHDSMKALCQGFFSEARFAYDNIQSMSVPPLLCLDACPHEWKVTTTEIAGEYLQLYYFFQLAKEKYRNYEPLPDIEEFLEVTSNAEQKYKICKQYISISGECDPGVFQLLEEMRPSFIPTLGYHQQNPACK